MRYQASPCRIAPARPTVISLSRPAAFVSPNFTACLRDSAECSEHIKCTCDEGKVHCEPKEVGTGLSCAEHQPVRACAFWGGEETNYCSCPTGTWICNPESCPTNRPEEGASCEQHYLLTCDYFYQKTHCNYLDLYWHCSCEGGVWRCSHDFEDCHFADPDAGVDVGAPAEDGSISARARARPMLGEDAGPICRSASRRITAVVARCPSARGVEIPDMVSGASAVAEEDSDGEERVQQEAVFSGHHRLRKKLPALLPKAPAPSPL